MGRVVVVRATFVVALLGCLLLLTLLTLVTEGTAAAALMRSNSRDSAVFESEAIVSASLVAETVRDGGPPSARLARFRVETVLSGTLRRGEELALDLSAFTPWAGHTPRIAPLVYLFLVPPPSWSKGPHATPWRVSRNGVRLVVDGKIVLFSQVNNPGLYEPTAYELTEDGAEFDRPAFEAEIRRLLVRTSEVRAALATPASAARTEKLLAFLPSADGPPLADDAEAVGHAMQEAFAKEGNLGGYLEVESRGIDSDWRKLPFELIDFVAAATNVREVRRRRLAALTIVDRSYGNALAATPALVARLARLVDDGDPAIRRAAAALSFPENGTPPSLEAAIVARSRSETDPRVRYALLVAARRGGFVAKLALRPDELPVVDASVLDGQVLEVRQAGRTATDVAGETVGLKVTLRTGSTVVVSEALDLPGETINGPDRDLSQHLSFKSPVKSGIYEIDVELVTKRANGTVFTRTFALGRVGYRTPPKNVRMLDIGIGMMGHIARMNRDGGADEDGGGPADLDGSSAVDAGRAAAPSTGPAPRACHCTVVGGRATAATSDGDGGGPRRPPLLGLFAAAAIVARRLRRGASSPRDVRAPRRARRVRTLPP